jgi:isopentenyl diphosphate isomerase/L-lactate dehydrogenase-like FMN-dependent dehydrogenase/predicted heme/steroid binding protein
MADKVASTATRPEQASPPSYTLAEVAKHNTKEDCWLAVNGKVYDVTQWLTDHPGGGAIVLLSAGQDATETFTNFHNDSVLGDDGVGARFEIGLLAPPAGEPSTATVSSGSSATATVASSGTHHPLATLMSQSADTDATDDAKFRSVGGANLIATDEAPAKELDVTIPTSELALLKNVIEMEELAIARLPEPAARFIAYGSEDEESRLANRAAWGRYALRPRAAVGRNVTRVDLSTTVLGRRVALPLLLGAAGGHGIAHTMGEIAVARAAAIAGTVGGIAQRAKFKLSEIYSEAADCTAAQEAEPFLVWQLYAPRYSDRDEMDREYCEKVIIYAASCGYHALVVTVDTPVPGNRERTYNDPAWSLGMQEQVGGFPAVHSTDDSGAPENLPGGHCAAMSWDDITWMSTLSDMKIIVKGILTAEDASAAADCPGVVGLVCSNHGGRQLDGTLGAAEALEEVVAAVKASGNPACEVYIDGGVRRGRDVVRALALGATAVFVGRPVFWGLALGGQAGVERMIEMFANEMTICMQLCGCSSIADISRATVHDRGSGAGSTSVALSAALAAKDREIAVLRESIESMRESQQLAMQLLAKM